MNTYVNTPDYNRTAAKRSRRLRNFAESLWGTLSLIVVAALVIFGGATLVTYLMPDSAAGEDRHKVAVTNPDGTSGGIYWPEELTERQLLDDSTVSDAELDGTEPDGAQPDSWYDTHPVIPIVPTPVIEDEEPVEPVVVENETPDDAVVVEEDEYNPADPEDNPESYLDYITVSDLLEAANLECPDDFTPTCHNWMGETYINDVYYGVNQLPTFVAE